MGNSLIGSYSARLDKSGRLKIPEKFRTAIEEQYGKSLFITSLTDEAVQIYPLPIWEKLTGITEEGLTHLKPKVRMFMLRVNRMGNKYELDSKGRILITQPLREKADLDGEVEVIGLNNHLEIWNKQILDQTLEQKPLTHEDFEGIASLSQKERKE